MVIINSLPVNHFRKRNRKNKINQCSFYIYSFHDFFFCILATIRLDFDVSKCNGQQNSVIDDTSHQRFIISNCNCTIKSHFSGKVLLRNDDSCSTSFNVLDGNSNLIETICDGNPVRVAQNVTKNDQLFLIRNYSTTQTRNPTDYVNIYAAGMFNINLEL